MISIPRSSAAKLAKVVLQTLGIAREAQSAKVRIYFRKPLISLKAGCEAQSPPYPLRARARVRDALVRLNAGQGRAA